MSADAKLRNGIVALAQQRDGLLSDIIAMQKKQERLKSALRGLLAVVWRNPEHPTSRTEVAVRAAEKALKE